MTYQEINEALKAQTDGRVQDFAYEDTDFTPFGKVEEVDSQGGMDEGSDWRKVFHFKDHDVYIEVAGFYQSHYGTDFEAWDSAVSQVFPKQITKTIYV